MVSSSATTSAKLSGSQRRSKKSTGSSARATAVQEALTAIGTRLRGIVYAARPSDVSLKVHILEFDAVPIQPLKNAELLLGRNLCKFGLMGGLGQKLPDVRLVG